MERDGVQQIALGLRGGIIGDAVTPTDHAELFQQFHGFWRHILDFDIHKMTSHQERYVLKIEMAA